MTSALVRSAAVALLVMFAAGCGSAGAARPAQKQPTSPVQSAATPVQTAPAPTASAPVHRRHRRAPTHSAAPPAYTPPAYTPPPAPSPSANPIPQHNGGDQDADNNGGPSDGDGDI